MKTITKHHLFFRVITILITGLLFSGCAFKGTGLTNSGVDIEPHAVWNGSHFGIVYYHKSTPTSMPQINVVKVDKNANIITTKSNVGSIPHLYVPFRLSDLVWNNDNKQFAFAYTKGKVIHFIRLDANLNPIAGSPLVVKFPGPVNNYEHPTLIDLSLVWNHVKKEYGLMYITREHPYLPERHDDIYISRISSGGTYIGPYERIHIVTCPDDCEKTSLTYNGSSGQYAFSYLKNDNIKDNVMIGLYNPGGTVSEHALMTSWNPGSGAATRIIYDARSNEYVVVALKSKPGISNGHEICYQFAGSNGVGKGTHYVKTSKQGYNEIVSIANFLSPVKNKYLLCASEKPQIHCWLATQTGFVGNDMAYTSSSVNSLHPSLSVTDATYMSWIQNGTLYFGVAKK